MQIDLSKIKLIIWDLDDTLWNGTLSEGGITPIAENIQLVKDLTDCGIINSICSKNDMEPVEAKLKELNVDEYFVFKSVDWTPKGPRIASMIRDMGLRPVNVLFLDDNTVNLNEAKHYSPDLKVEDPTVISDIIQQCAALPIKDTAHKRLKQYQVLEEKQKAKSQAGDNLSFLFSTNTQVEIHKDCIAEIDRLTELVNRTNQLNFTKVRSTKEELTALLSEEGVDAGYVTVKDNFGDYGIVGFYAVKDGKCIHFLFSCRTIGQGVEQYVYSTLGWPELTVVAEVVNQVTNDEAPKWINQKNAETLTNQSKASNVKVIFKGGCDLMNMSAYLATSNVIEEFTYIGEARKNNIEHHYHTRNLLTYPFLSQQEQKQIVELYIFEDKDAFKTHVYDSDVAVVFLGVMIEPNLGVYRHKTTGREFAFCEYGHPLTDPTEWDNYINGTIFNADNQFTKEWLQWFAENHDFLGPLNVEQILGDYKALLKKMSPSAKLCLLLGSETPFEKETNPNYFGREKVYKQINDLLRAWAAEEERVLVLDFNKYIRGQEDFTNNINHFQRRVYFEAAKEANAIIAGLTGEKLQQKSRLYMKVKTWGDQLGSTGFYQTKLWSVLRVPYVWLAKLLK